MSCKYHFIISRHPVDGVHLALDHLKHGAEGRLIVLVAEDPSCAYAFGKQIPDQFPGLAGLNRYHPKDLQVKIQANGIHAPIIFPATATRHGAVYAELIDRLRYSLRHLREVVFCLEYGRLRGDLPPLRPTDSLQCCWEVRDLLEARDMEYFQHVARRRGQEEFDFLGINFYLRRSYPDFTGEQHEALRERAEQLRQALGDLGDSAPGGLLEI
jgi:hypothetical protein